MVVARDRRPASPALPLELRGAPGIVIEAVVPSISAVEVRVERVQAGVGNRERLAVLVVQGAAGARAGGQARRGHHGRARGDVRRCADRLFAGCTFRQNCRGCWPIWFGQINPTLSYVHYGH